ncbi:MAG: hypothetical protein ABI585_08520 [Betaproteobacteria bacterium]
MRVALESMVATAGKAFARALDRIGGMTLASRGLRSRSASARTPRQIPIHLGAGLLLRVH